MSDFDLTSLNANNVTSNVIIIGNTGIVNSTVISVSNGALTINTSAIKITDGSNFVTVNNNISVSSITIQDKIETANVQIFTANGTWTKPSWATTGNELVVVHMWGGGGGGQSGGGGGGGGAFVFGYYKASLCNSVCNVVVGIGGAGSSGSSGSRGGNSIFWSNTTNPFTAYGGGGGSAGDGGEGGGWRADGGPLVDVTTGSTFGAGVGSSGISPGNKSSVYGGGGGSDDTFLGAGGNSVFGGGGGSNATSVVGRSIFGGSGANATVAAGIPGGGGSDAASGNRDGARGEVRIYTYRIL